jgi:ketosteroid isomerase-like protein
VSRENVEIVRRVIKAGNTRPKPDFDVINALCDPDHVLVAQLSGVEGTIYHGARGYREWLTDMAQTFEWLGARLGQVTEIDDHRVLVVSTLSLRSRRGGVPLEQDVASIMTVRDGKVVRTENYPLVEQALQAVDPSGKAISANLDLVRSIYADWERGDVSSTEWAHTEIEFVIADGPAPGSWSGLAGLARGVREFMNAWNGVHIVADEYRTLDADRVLILVRVVAHGKTSGLDLQGMRTEGANLFNIRDGKVTRLVVYLERRRALADLGLEE